MVILLRLLLSIPNKSTFGPFWSRNVKNRSKWPKWSKWFEIFQIFPKWSYRSKTWNFRKVLFSGTPCRYTSVWTGQLLGRSKIRYAPIQGGAKLAGFHGVQTQTLLLSRAYFLYWNKKFHVFANCYKKEFSRQWKALFCIKLLFYSEECLIFALAISLPIWWRSSYYSTD